LDHCGKILEARSRLAFAPSLRAQRSNLRERSPQPINRLRDDNREGEVASQLKINPKFMLPKLHRINQTRDFEKTFKLSRPIHAVNLSFRILENKKPDAVTRFGFIVSNKIEKRAVRRNALKRQLREIALSLISSLKSGYDIVTVVKRDFPFPYNQEEIKNQFVEGMKRAGILK
jgi:ribonuclease P protein component